MEQFLSKLNKKIYGAYLWGTLLVFLLGGFVFAKTLEYRPMLISYRTVAASIAYQPSMIRVTYVSVSAQISCSVTIAGGSTGSTALQISADNITYTTISQITNSSTGALVVGLTLNNSNGGILTAAVQPGYYYKIVNTTAAGTPVYAILTQAEEINL